MTDNSIRNKSLTDKTFSGLVWISSSSFLQSILRVVIVAVLARILDPEHFGIIAAAMVVINFTTMFSQMGLAQAVVQAKELSDDAMNASFTLSVVLGLVMTGIFYLLNPFINMFFKMEGLLEVLNVLIWLFPVISVAQISAGILQRGMRFKKLAGLDVLSYLLGYGIVGISLSYMQYGVWALVWATMVQSMSYAALLFLVSTHHFRLSLDFGAIRSILRFGSSFTLLKLFNFFAMKGDYILVGRLLGADSLGIYSRAYGLMNAPNSITGKVMQTVFFSSFSRIQHDREKTSLNLEKGLEILFLLTIPLSLLSYLLAPELVMALLGPKWTAVILPFQILAVSILFRMAYKMMASMVLGTGKVLEYAYVQFIFMLCVLGGTYLGSEIGGVPGVAVGVTLAILINWILVILLSLKHSNLKSRNILLAMVPGLVLALLFLVICQPLITFLRQYEVNIWLILILVSVLAMMIGIIIYRYRINIPGSKHLGWFFDYLQSKIHL